MLQLINVKAQKGPSMQLHKARPLAKYAKKIKPLCLDIKLYCKIGWNVWFLIKSKAVYHSKHTLENFNI